MTSKRLSSCGCGEIRAAIDLIPKSEGAPYAEIKRLLADSSAVGNLKLLAGDCEIDEDLDPEEHFSVCHFLACVQCKETFFIGVCCRGPLKCEYGKPIPNAQSLKNLYWGRVGSLFDG